MTRQEGKRLRDRKKALLEDTRLFVLDMDGTFFMGQRVIDGALDFMEIIEKRGQEFLFFTNNSSKAPEDYIEKLTRAGCPISRDQIMTSGDVAIRYLHRTYPGASVYLLGTPQLEKSMEEAGIRLTKDKADIVLAGFDMTLSYEKLERGCTFIRNGAVFLATHPDINCPVEGGFIPDCGAICAAMSLSCGKEPRYLGKPYEETVQMIFDKTKIPIAKTAFVGDRLYTDIATGVRHGGRGFLVLTGEATLEDAAASDVKPDAIFDSLGEMASYLKS